MWPMLHTQLKKKKKLKKVAFDNALLYGEVSAKD